MELIENIPLWGTEVDPGALVLIKNCARNADRAAMMADHHKGYSVRRYEPDHGWHLEDCQLRYRA